MAHRAKAGVLAVVVSRLLESVVDVAGLTRLPSRQNCGEVGSGLSLTSAFTEIECPVLAVPVVQRLKPERLQSI
jgi:hypothetical protein